MGEGKKAQNFGPPTLRGPTLRGPTFSRFGLPPFRAPPLHELCLPTTEDGRVGGGEDFGLSRTSLNVIFFWPKSNKGPIGLSRIGLCRARPLRQTAQNFAVFFPSPATFSFPNREAPKGGVPDWPKSVPSETRPHHSQLNWPKSNDIILTRSNFTWMEHLSFLFLFFFENKSITSPDTVAYPTLTSRSGGVGPSTPWTPRCSNSVKANGTAGQHSLLQQRRLLVGLRSGQLAEEVPALVRPPNLANQDHEPCPVPTLDIDVACGVGRPTSRHHPHQRTVGAGHSPVPEETPLWCR